MFGRRRKDFKPIGLTVAKDHQEHNVVLQNENTNTLRSEFPKSDAGDSGKTSDNSLGKLEQAASAENDVPGFSQAKGVAMSSVTNLVLLDSHATSAAIVATKTELSDASYVSLTPLNVVSSSDEAVTSINTSVLSTTTLAETAINVVETSCQLPAVTDTDTVSNLCLETEQTLQIDPITAADALDDRHHTEIVDKSVKARRDKKLSKPATVLSESVENIQDAPDVGSTKKTSKATAEKGTRAKALKTDTNRPAVTMADLIYWNPKDTEKMPLPKQVCQKSKAFSDSSPAVTTDSSLPAPQVRVGPDGEIIIDESTLVVEQPKIVREDDDIVDESLGRSHPNLYRKKLVKVRMWSESDTEDFYKVLSCTGTDFSLMSEFFPHRTRQEIKRKFKREENLNRSRIDAVLKERRPLDASLYDLSKNRREREEGLAEKRAHQEETIKFVLEKSNDPSFLMGSEDTYSPENTVANELSSPNGKRPRRPKETDPLKVPTSVILEKRSGKRARQDETIRSVVERSADLNLEDEFHQNNYEVSGLKPKRKRRAAGAELHSSETNCYVKMEDSERMVDDESLETESLDEFERRARRIISEYMTIDRVAQRVVGKVENNTATDEDSILEPLQNAEVDEPCSSLAINNSAVNGGPKLSSAAESSAENTNLSVNPLLQLQLPAGVNKVQVLSQSSLAGSGLDMSSLTAGQVILVHEKSSIPGQADLIHVYLVSATGEESSSSSNSQVTTAPTTLDQ